MVGKHVPKAIKREISFQYHMSQKKKGMFVLKNPSEVKLRGVLTCASLNPAKIKTLEGVTDIHIFSRRLLN